MDRRLHLGDGDIENFFELPSSELDRPSEGDIFYDSDIDPEYRPSDDSPESENEQLSVDNTVLSADLINSSEDSETFHDETDIETSINQPNQQESFDPGEGTSSHQDTGTTNNQSREQGNGRSSFQRQAQKTRVTWKEVTRSFNPKHVMPPTKAPIVLANVQRNSSELHVFLQVFPKSLLMFISHCTNERLKILMNKKKTKIEMTDYHEMMIIHGCILIMCYNRLPNISDYWSMQESMGNRAIIRAISRNRFQLLISKLYFNIPDKPVNSNKTYYIDEVVSCLKSTFSKARSESTFQSIDESMAKFKGKSAMKQYLPLKPIKRGIKIWERCDSYTGYCYDFNIYAGKETDNVDGTLGERVVGKLSSSIQTEKKQVVLAFDRFFTSVKLLSEIEHPSVATCIGNRVNVPKFDTKIEKYGSDFLCCDEGVLAVAWKDSKQFVVLSNFHKNTVSTVKRMQKDGHKIDVPCPDAIILYNQIMGGVDLSDQKAGVYDFDRKSKKWWKKVFYKLFLTAVVNAWILHREVTHKKTPLLSFIVPLAEQLLDAGLMHTLNKRRRNTGRPSKRVKMMNNVGDHLPIQLEKRRRCKRCSDQKIEKRTKTFCRECQLPLCNDCFTLYHE